MNLGFHKRWGNLTSSGGTLLHGVRPVLRSRNIPTCEGRRTTKAIITKIPVLRFSTVLYNPRSNSRAATKRFSLVSGH